MSKLHNLSGAEVIRVLTKEFGFSAVRQRGSHVVLRKYVDSKKVVTIVPLHREIKIGTLLGMLELGKVAKGEFLSKLK